jgi:hypothetical protein
MQNWTDLNVDGRRLNKIIRDMNSKINKETLDDLTRQRIQLAIAIVLVSIVVAIPTWYVIETGITPNTDVYTDQELIDRKIR